MKIIAKILRCLRLRPALVATLTAVCLCLTTGLHAQPVVETLTGGWWQGNTTTFYGSTNGSTFRVAQFNFPSGLALDLTGSNLYVADFTNNSVRLISNLGNTNTSLTTTFAATNKGIWRPVAVAVDSTNNVYVLNRSTNGNSGTVLKFDSAGNLIRTNAANLTNATAIALDSLNNIYVTLKSNTVMRITPTATNFFTISNSVTYLRGICVLDDGRLALTDSGSNGVWVLDPATGISAKLAGFHGNNDILGAATTNAFKRPEMIAKAGNGMLVVADRGSHKVKLIDSISGNVTRLYGVSSNLWVAGSQSSGIFPGWWDGTVNTNEFLQGSVEAREPLGVLVAPDGSVYTTEVYYHIIRHTTDTGLVGPQPSTPMGIALDDAGGNLYIADATNNVVKVLNFANNQTATYLTSADGISRPVDVAFDAATNLFVLSQDTGSSGYISQFDQWRNLVATNATGLTQPTAFAMDSSGNFLITELTGAIRVFTPAGVSSTLVTITNAGVQLQGIAIFDDGNLAVSDSGNHVIWQINPLTKVISRLTGQLGVSGANFGSNNVAKLNQPYRLTRVAGNNLLAADYGNNRLVVIQRSGTIPNALVSSNSTVWFGRTGDPVSTTNSHWVSMISPIGVAVSAAGTAYSSEAFYHNIRGITAAGVTKAPPAPLNILAFFNGPLGIALDSAGTHLYIADTTNNALQVLDLGSNQTSTYLGVAEGMNRPVAVVLDSTDNIYVLNQGTGGNGSILKFDEYGNLLATIATGLSMPTAVTVDFSGNLYVAEQGGAVQQFTGASSNTIVTIASPGVQLQGIALFDDGVLAVSDAGNHVIRQINLSTLAVSVLTGQSGTPGTTLGSAAFAKLNRPLHLSRSAGNRLVAADYGNNRLVVVERSGAVTNVLASTNSTVWFGHSDDPFATGNARWVSMVAPAGVAVGSGVVYSSEIYYNNIRRVTAPGLTPPPPPAAVPAPTIGWVDYTIPPATVVSILRSDASGSYVFNNDVTIAILGTPATLTHYTFGDTASLGTIPNPDASVGSAPPAYHDGMYPIEVPPSIIIPPQPDVTIKAVGYNPGSPSSAVVQARFQFITASPFISGNNAAQFTVTSQTTGAQMYYTTNGVDPTNVLSGSNFGPVSSGVTLSLNITTNTLFKIRAFRSNYQPSSVASALFSPTNFVANRVTFGFENGEASSDFVASPGQNFYAPVTLSILPGVKMYSLQFNLTATNLTGPVINPGALYFRSMLDKPIPNISPVVYEVIPPAMFTLNPPPTNSIVLDGSANFMNLIFTNSSLNLLGVGWLERAGKTNLYNTLQQDLVTFSIAHDTLFLSAAGKVVAGGFSFTVPGTATNGQTYQIQVARASATSDGIGAPGSDVYIATPTNGALAGGTINSLKTVTVGQRRYTVGNVYPFRWFNAGDFGNSSLANADVVQVFQSAIYNLNNPPAGSDFLDAMDSCCGTVDTSTNGMYTYPASLTNTLVTSTTNIFVNTVITTNVTWNTNTSALTNFAFDVSFTNFTTNVVSGTNFVLQVITTYQTNVLGGTIIITQNIFNTTNTSSFTNISVNTTAQLPLYDGNDTLINSVAFGDGNLDVADVYVTFRRSLDPSRTWFQRFWTNGVRGAVTTPNVFNHFAAANVKTPAPNKSSGGTSSAVTVKPAVIFTASDAVTGPGQTVAIPITANILGNYPLRVLMLNLTVEALDGSPTITTPVQFIPNPALGTPYATTQEGANNYGAVWLNNTIVGLTGNATVGTLQITLPAGATAASAYAIHFAHASASPNGVAVFPKTTYTGLVTLGDRSTSSWNDGIPDSWRLRNFGTIYNILSAAHADADGDSADNWKEYKAGTNPNDAKSVLRMQPVSSPFNVRWPSIFGKTYIIERSTALYSGNWSTISTNSGTGDDIQILDDNSSVGSTRFYRVRVAE